MKPEKMTPEELDLARRDAALPLNMQTPPPDERRRLLAHIAALEAERDEWKGNSERNAVLANDRAMKIGHLIRERDALRERVTGLEAELEAAQATLEDEQAAHAETLKQVKALEGELEQEQTLSAHLQERTNAAESTLAAIRQRAGDAKALAEVLRRTEATWTDEAMAEVARYIVGEDGADASGAIPGEATATPDPSVAAPTTAEAFSRLRLPPNGSLDGSEYDALLSLLERRMGAMARELTDIPKRLAMWADEARRSGDEDHADALDSIHDSLHDTIQAALTDAPPAFTLEEVEKMLHHVVDLDAPSRKGVVRSGLDYLAALRR